MKYLSHFFRVSFIYLVFGSLLNGIGVPEWSSDAIWYQIFPDRFFNGDKSNDPTKESLYGNWPWEDQGWWEVSPWTSDWYEFQPWEKANGEPLRYQFQIRRYGGDLQGIIDKLDYLKDLGINAIYLNPIFDSPSSHKYGAAFYHHVDRHFGPDPIGDTQLMLQEKPDDPTTWQWTSADKLFLKLIREVHSRDMHIIIDGVFNHVGLTFWAFQDVIKNREKSPYFSWFNIEGSTLPDHSHLNQYKTLPDYFLEKGQIPFRYTGYVEDLPAFRQDKYGPVVPVRDHIHQVVKRWMDPDGDGDPADGIDGWRLDVAERIQIKFWDIFCGWVKEINPDAYITGEVWWEDWWNNKQFNAAPWLQDGRFDAVMNYRFGDAVYKFFINKNQQITPTEFNRLLKQVRDDYPVDKLPGLQNMLDSHDMERLASAVVNPDRWIDHGNHMEYNPEFKIRKPNQEERRLQKLILTFQFTYPGAPFIYYGDEVGMWGADDPDCRKPMVWKEFTYDDEITHPCDYSKDCNATRPRDKVSIDKDLFAHYKTLIKLRKAYPSLKRGAYHTIYLDDEKGLFVFERILDRERIIAVFNASDKLVRLPDEIRDVNWELILGSDYSKNINAKSAKIFVDN